MSLNFQMKVHVAVKYFNMINDKDISYNLF